MHQLNNLKKIPNIVHGFSEIKDGNMSFVWGDKEEVSRNRKVFLEELDVKPENCAAIFLKHGIDIAIVDEFSRGEEKIEVDCLITKSKDVFLFVLTADCLPVILYDPIKGVLALVHLSRINSPQNFIRAVVEKMKSEYGVQPENIIAGIGPCIKKESYIFPSEELKKVIPDEKVFEGFILDLHDGRKIIDLVGYNVSQLVSAGVRKENIEISEIDTFKNKNFFSHSRSRANGEPEGRMATVVGMI